MEMSDIVNEITPVEKRGSLWVKREDLFEICGVSGAKARGAYILIKDLISKGIKEIVSGGVNGSPQCEIVYSICTELGVKCTLFMPEKKDSTLSDNKWVKINRTRGNYRRVDLLEILVERYSKETGAGAVSYGMLAEKIVKCTERQIENIPDVKRIVIPVGSGVNFCGVVNGLSKAGRETPVVGVRVGYPADKVLKKYLSNIYYPYEIVKSSHKYGDVCERSIGGLVLDPIYEAKCCEFLEDGDLLWVVGRRKNLSLRAGYLNLLD